VWQRSRKRRSSSERIGGAGPRWVASRAARGLRPRRPRLLSSSCSIALMSISSRRSASSNARRSWVGETTSARSSSVRGTELTGIPSRTHRSSECGCRTRCTLMADEIARVRPGAVTSIAAREVGRSPQRAPALWWLRNAPVPQARTAAIQRPRSVSRVWPTAYTAGWSRCRRPAAMRWWMAPLPKPSFASWLRPTTPCWRAASAATTPSRGPVRALMSCAQSGPRRASGQRWQAKAREWAYECGDSVPLTTASRGGETGRGGCPA
jgi:hypothetical protein